MNAIHFIFCIKYCDFKQTVVLYMLCPSRFPIWGMQTPMASMLGVLKNNIGNGGNCKKDLTRIF